MAKMSPLDIHIHIHGSTELNDLKGTLMSLNEPLPPGVQGVGVSTVWAGSQAAYDAISTPDPNTLYFVTG